jgi:hypothetical protein
MKEYTEMDMRMMREQLVESEHDGMSDNDIKAILMDGCVGWKNASDEEIVAQYESIWGEMEV